MPPNIRKPPNAIKTTCFSIVLLNSSVSIPPHLEINIPSFSIYIPDRIPPWNKPTYLIQNPLEPYLGHLGLPYAPVKTILGSLGSPLA